jgi:hypothetical protein
MPRATIIDPMADTRFEASFGTRSAMGEPSGPMAAVPASKDDASFVIQPQTLGLDASFDEDDETMQSVANMDEVQDDLDALFCPSTVPQASSSPTIEI